MLIVLIWCLMCYGSAEGANTTTATPSIMTMPTPAATTTSRDANHLYCYQCSASSAGEPCVTDTGGMANISTRDIYIKDCTASNPKWNVCMIQWVEAGGKLLFFHRDCHDGAYFPPPYISSRLANVTANNMSTCDLINDKVFCYRPCQGNLCNGPKTYVNETDCSQFSYDADGNVTYPPGVECGTLGLHSRIDHVTLLIVLLMTAFLCVNANTLLSYL